MAQAYTVAGSGRVGMVHNTPSALRKFLPYHRAQELGTDFSPQHHNNLDGSALTRLGISRIPFQEVSGTES